MVVCTALAAQICNFIWKIFVSSEWWRNERECSIFCYIWTKTALEWLEWEIIKLF